MTVPALAKKWDQVTIASSTATVNTGIYATDKTWLSVSRTRSGVDTVLSVDTEYTVKSLGASGGCVLKMVGQAASDTITTTLSVPSGQLSNYPTGTTIDEQEVENDFDELELKIQQVQEKYERAFKLPVTATQAQRDAATINTDSTVGYTYQITGTNTAEFAAPPTFGGPAKVFANRSAMTSTTTGVTVGSRAVVLGEDGDFELTLSANPEAGNTYQGVGIDSNLSGYHWKRMFTGPIKADWWGFTVATAQEASEPASATTNSTALDNLITYLNTITGPKHVVFGEGYYHFTSKTVIWPDDITIEGAGIDQTHFVMCATRSATPPTATTGGNGAGDNATTWRWKGDNNSGSYAISSGNITLKNFSKGVLHYDEIIPANWSDSATAAAGILGEGVNYLMMGILMTRCKNVVLENVKINGSYNMGIAMWGCHNVTRTNCHTDRTFKDAIHASSFTGGQETRAQIASFNVTDLGCTVTDCYDDGFAFNSRTMNAAFESGLPYSSKYKNIGGSVTRPRRKATGLKIAGSSVVDVKGFSCYDSEVAAVTAIYDSFAPFPLYDIDIEATAYRCNRTAILSAIKNADIDITGYGSGSVRIFSKGTYDPENFDLNVSLHNYTTGPENGDKDEINSATNYVVVGRSGTITYDGTSYSIGATFTAPTAADWAATTSYTAGNYVTGTSEEVPTIHKCLLNHTSSSDFSADVTAGNWEALKYTRTAVAWVAGTFVMDEVRSNGGNNYRSLEGHKSTGAITAFADAGGGKVTVTSAGHTLSTGETVTISGTTNYNVSSVVDVIDGSNYKIEATWVSNDATGTWVTTFANDLAFHKWILEELEWGLPVPVFLTTGAINAEEVISGNITAFVDQPDKEAFHAKDTGTDLTLDIKIVEPRETYTTNGLVYIGSSITKSRGRVRVQSAGALTTTEIVNDATDRTAENFVLEGDFKPWINDLNVATVTLTSAQIKALNTTHITLVPARSGKRIMVEKIIADYTYNSAAYASANPIQFRLNSGSVSGSSITPTTGGASYSTATGVATTTDGIGTGLTVDTTASGAVTSFNVNASGQGYLAGDTITITGGNGAATYILLSSNLPAGSTGPEVVTQLAASVLTATTNSQTHLQAALTVSNPPSSGRLVAYIPAGDPTTGDSDIKLMIWYRFLENPLF